MSLQVTSIRDHHRAGVNVRQFANSVASKPVNLDRIVSVAAVRGAMLGAAQDRRCGHHVDLWYGGIAGHTLLGDSSNAKQKVGGDAHDEISVDLVKQWSRPTS
jgi:hypothetical protein